MNEDRFVRFVHQARIHRIGEAERVRAGCPRQQNSLDNACGDAARAQRNDQGALIDQATEAVREIQRLDRFARHGQQVLKQRPHAEHRAQRITAPDHENTVDVKRSSMRGGFRDGVSLALERRLHGRWLAPEFIARQFDSPAPFRILNILFRMRMCFVTFKLIQFAYHGACTLVERGIGRK
jgi:hypothetical protein